MCLAVLQITEAHTLQVSFAKIVFFKRKTKKAKMEKCTYFNTLPPVHLFLTQKHHNTLFLPHHIL